MDAIERDYLYNFGTEHEQDSVCGSCGCGPCACVDERLVDDYEGQEIDMAESVRRWSETHAARLGLTEAEWNDLCEREWFASDGTPKAFA
jgi:hypothetical protein